MRPTPPHPVPIGRRSLLRAVAFALAAPTPLVLGARRGAIQEGGREPTLPEEPTAPAGAPRPDARLTIGSPVEPTDLHPWAAPEIAAVDLLDGVVEGLLKVNAAGRLQPALAEGFTLSEDGRTYAFRLRENVTYHNGERFSGEDVVAAWEARLDGTWVASATLGWDRIAEIDVPDERTLTIVTDEPYAPLLSSVGIAPILPASAYAEGLQAFQERYGREPVGSGPFRLAGREPGRRIDLERWDGYWGSPATLAAIRYEVVPDGEALLAGLESGAIHAAGGAGGVPPELVDAAMMLSDVEVWSHPTRTWQHLDLKQIGFLRERAVRQALDYATPRDAIIEGILGGRATPAVADQMPGSWAAHETLRPRPFDPERARELLADAGLRPGRDGVLARGGEPFRLELWGVAGDRQAARILDAIAAEWAALGIAVLVRTAAPAELWGPLGYQFSDRMTACLYAWTNGIDPDDLFYWHSSQIPTAPTAPGGNLPAFFHPYAFEAEIDALTAEAASTLDLEARRELYAQIQELLVREVPVIFLFWEQAFPAARREVGGFWPTPYAGLLWNAATWYLAGDVPPATPEAGGTPVAGG